MSGRWLFNLADFAKRIYLAMTQSTEGEQQFRLCAENIVFRKLGGWLDHLDHSDQRRFTSQKISNIRV